MFGLSFIPAGLTWRQLRAPLLVVYLLSVMGVGVGLNAGLVADSPAEADIDVAGHVAEIDAEPVESEPPTPYEDKIGWLDDPIEVKLLPEPYHSRLGAWLETQVLGMTKAAMRYSLTIADVAAGVAYAHQDTVGHPITLVAIKAWMAVAILLPPGLLLGNDIAAGWRAARAR